MLESKGDDYTPSCLVYNYYAKLGKYRQFKKDYI